jgi:catechol 2,3-dioxygenase-like lactoylglutathione lyase family enzyme
MIATKGLRHIQFVVRDKERALAFYARLFGVEEQFRDGGAIFASVPGGGDMLTFAEQREWQPGEHKGLRHFGFAVDRDLDVAAARAEIEAAGGTRIRSGEHGEGEPYIYFFDLDGYEVELYAS